VFNMTKPVCDGMVERGWGRIINISSVNGQKGAFGQTNYSAAKAGMHGFTKSLALEVAPRGVTVNAVCPGYTETDMVAQAVQNIVRKTGRGEDAARVELAAANPQQRLVQPQEVADAVAWLCLPASSAMNGQSIAVAGGEVM
ncbi:SDR family oxidoreductase, partial [Streptococcus danieliae]|nr:SDR family oxidoreductase [Streptococcus danieliae]